MPTSGLSDASALVLGKDDRLRFVPAADYNGTPAGAALTVRVADSEPAASDKGTGKNLGNMADLTSTWSATTMVGVTVNPVNDPPGFTHTVSNPTFTENGDTGQGTANPVKLLGTGAVSDIDPATTGGLNGAIFGAGSVTVTLTDGIASDVLRLDSLTAGSNGIASITGGTNGNPLVVTFTNAATNAQVEAVLAAIEYTNASDDPTDKLSGTAKTTRNYEVVLSDGNNVQAGGNAGGPDPLTATKSGTITINAANDPPVATPNTNTVYEDNAGGTGSSTVTGNVKTDGTADSDPDNVMTDVPVTSITATTAGGSATAVADNAGTVVTGKYGTLTIHPDGSYSYVLDNTNPDVNALNTSQKLTEVFNYTIQDPDTLTASSTLTITINGQTDGAPAIVPTDHNGTGPGAGTDADEAAAAATCRRSASRSAHASITARSAGGT